MNPPAHTHLREPRTPPPPDDFPGHNTFSGEGWQNRVRSRSQAGARHVWVWAGADGHTEDGGLAGVVQAEDQDPDLLAAEEPGAGAWGELHWSGRLDGSVP